MYKKCTCCGRFYNQQKYDKMCKECKKQLDDVLIKIKENKALQDVMPRLADR